MGEIEGTEVHTHFETEGHDAADLEYPVVSDGAANATVSDGSNESGGAEQHDADGDSHQHAAAGAGSPIALSVAALSFAVVAASSSDGDASTDSHGSPRPARRDPAAGRGGGSPIAEFSADRREQHGIARVAREDVRFDRLAGLVAVDGHLRGFDRQFQRAIAVRAGHHARRYDGEDRQTGPSPASAPDCLRPNHYSDRSRSLSRTYVPERDAGDGRGE